MEPERLFWSREDGLGGDEQRLLVHPDRRHPERARMEPVRCNLRIDALATWPLAQVHTGIPSRDHLTLV